MPLKNPYLGQSAQAQPAPSLWERIGKLPGLIGTGIRATTGVLSAEGGPLGALTSGGGEAAAEMVEGSAFKPSRLDPNSMLGGLQASLDPGENESPLSARLKGFAQGAISPVARIGTAAGLGAVPFGKVLQAGKPLASAGRGALYSGVGEFGREIAEGRQVDPGAIGTSAAVGGTLNAGLASLFGKAGAPPPQSYEVEPTIRTGRGTSVGGGKARQENTFPPRPITDIPTIKATEPLPALATEAAATRPRVSQPIPYSYAEGAVGGPAEKSAARESAQATKEAIRDQRNLANVEKWLARTRAATAKTAEQEQAATAIAKARAGLVPSEPKVSESISAPIPGGRERMSTSYGPPEPEGGGEEELLGALGKALGVAPKAAKGAGRVVSTEQVDSAKTIFEAWRAKGVDEQKALDLAAKGISPRPFVPQAPAVEGAASPAEVVTKANSPLAGRTPSARYLGEQEGVGSLYNILGGESHGSTVGSESLQRMGIDVPPGAVAGPVTSDSIASAKAAAQAEREAAMRAVPGKVINAEGKFQPADVIDVAPQPKAVGGATRPPSPDDIMGQNLASQGREVDLSGNVNALGAPPAPPAPAVSQAMAHAKANFPDEVNTELDRLGEAYRSTPKGPEKSALGAQMAELRDFMSGKKMRESWKGAPTEAAVAPPAPAPIAQQLEESLAAHEPQTRSIEPDVPAVRTEQNYEERGGKLDELLKLLKSQSSGPGLGSEKGAINPALLAKLGLGLGGAAVGAAVDPLNNRVESALAGGAAGVGITQLPQVLSKMGAAPQLLSSLAEHIKTPEGITEAAGKIWHAIPQMQRFNYLMDAEGLPANALAGPYGSATFAAIEHALSGDPRGTEALQLLADPRNFARELRSSWFEAKEHINRSEGRWFETGPTNTFERAMAIPGTAMTAGDVAAKRILMRAGFSPEEAQRITLTSEPELAPFKKVANLTKGSPFMQALMPFARTPANIGEQGMQRLPVIGSIIQAQRETPDPIKQQAIQQLMSLGIGGASYGLGANLDPETAKMVRRYVSNFGGQYSLPASIGFAAGQSVHAGKPALSPATIGTAVDVLPLPTIQPIQEWAKFLSGNGPMPHGAMPPDVRALFFPPAASSPATRLPRLRRSQ